MSYEPPTPPAELPTDLVNTLNGYSPDQFQHVARYAEELAEHKAREARLKEESKDEEIDELPDDRSLADAFGVEAVEGPENIAYVVGNFVAPAGSRLVAVEVDRGAGARFGSLLVAVRMENIGEGVVIPFDDLSPSPGDVVAGGDTNVLAVVYLDGRVVVVAAPRLGVDIEFRLWDAVERYLAAVHGVHAAAGGRHVGVRTARVLEDRLKGWVNVAGVGITDVVAVDERERVGPPLYENQIRGQRRVYVRPLAGGVVVGVNVLVVAVALPVVPGVVVALVETRRLSVVRVRALDRRVGVRPERVWCLAVSPTHPRLAFDLGWRPRLVVDRVESAPAQRSTAASSAVFSVPGVG